MDIIFKAALLSFKLHGHYLHCCCCLLKHLATLNQVTWALSTVIIEGKWMLRSKMRNSPTSFHPVLQCHSLSESLRGVTNKVESYQTKVNELFAKGTKEKCLGRRMGGVEGKARFTGIREVHEVERSAYYILLL